MPPAATSASVLTPVFAQIQADVGAFLALKQALLAARGRTTHPGVAARLDQLLAEQAELEARLPGAVEAAQRLGRGEISLDDAATAAEFYAAMQAHLARARGVLDDVAPAPVQTSARSPAGTLVLWAGGALVGWLVFRKVTNPVVLLGAAVGGYLLWRRVNGGAGVPVPGGIG
jgi:hypothetical protein